MPKLEMRRVHFQVLKDKSLSPPDRAQVPADGARVWVHRQGATVRTSTTFAGGEPADVPVENVGRTRVGDVLIWSRILPDEQSAFLVNSITDGAVASVNLTPYSEETIEVFAGDRLIPAPYDDIQVYSDSVAHT